MRRLSVFTECTECKTTSENSRELSYCISLHKIVMLVLDNDIDIMAITWNRYRKWPCLIQRFVNQRFYQVNPRTSFRKKILYLSYFGMNQGKYIILITVNDVSNLNVFRFYLIYELEQFERYLLPTYSWENIVGHYLLNINYCTGSFLCHDLTDIYYSGIIFIFFKNGEICSSCD